MLKNKNNKIAVYVPKTKTVNPTQPPAWFKAWFKEFKVEFDAFVSAQIQFNKDMLEFKDDMLEFKDDMLEFKDFVMNQFKKHKWI